MSAPWDPLAGLTEAQGAQLAAYADALFSVNRRVNLISPASAREIEVRHVLHALALSRRGFPAGATVVDLGTGGGLPAVPLAIRFPDVRFVGVDAVGKKVEAVRLFARRLGLENLDVWAGRAERWPGRANYAVSRATAPLVELWRWFTAVSEPLDVLPPGCWSPGLVCLKGGDLTDEVATLHDAFPGLRVEREALGPLLGRPYFEGKEIVAVHFLMPRRIPLPL